MDPLRFAVSDFSVILFKKTEKLKTGADEKDTYGTLPKKRNNMKYKKHTHKKNKLGTHNIFFFKKTLKKTLTSK